MTALPYLPSSRLAMVKQMLVLVGEGYYFYFLGKIPKGKSVERVDRKILDRYDLEVSKYVFVRRKKKGIARVRYLRQGRTFILLATHGEHELFRAEKLKDCRRHPIKYYGHSVSFRGGKVSVKMHAETEKKFKRWVLGRATEWSVGKWERFWREEFPRHFQPWKPVKDLVFTLIREINRTRKRKGLPKVDPKCYSPKKKILKVFPETPGK